MRSNSWKLEAIRGPAERAAVVILYHALLPDKMEGAPMKRSMWVAGCAEAIVDAKCALRTWICGCYAAGVHNETDTELSDAKPSAITIQYHATGASNAILTLYITLNIHLHDLARRS